MTLTGKEIQSMITTEGTGIISRKDGRACLEYAAKGVLESPPIGIRAIDYCQSSYQCKWIPLFITW